MGAAEPVLRDATAAVEVSFTETLDALRGWATAALRVTPPHARLMSEGCQER